MIRFTVPGEPCAQPRYTPRKMQGFVRMVMPDASPIHAYKAAVKMCAQEAYNGPPLKGPLSIEIVAVWPRPKNKFWKTKPTPRIPKDTKPDVDNVCKAVLDALNKQLFGDDAQIVKATVSKFYAAGSEQPATWVVIEEGE